MIVSALSEATLNHLEMPNRVNEDFWGGVDGIGQQYSVTHVGVSASNTGVEVFFGVSLL